MCTPLSHAGAAFFVPTVIKGGSLYVLPRFDPAEVLRIDRGAADHRDHAGALDALRPDGPPRLAHARPVVAGDRLLRRLGDQPGAAGARRSSGSGRSSRSTTASPRRRWRSATSPRATTDERRGWPPRAGGRRRSCARRCSTRTASRWRRASRARSAWPARCSPAATGSCRTRRPRRSGDGWLHTGDVAREDEDGFWYIVDRIKDMIVTGGFNVFPREVEDVVAEHPAVAQVGVIGMPDEQVGRGGDGGRGPARTGRRRLTDERDRRDPADGEGAQGRRCSRRSR